MMNTVLKKILPILFLFLFSSSKAEDVKISPFLKNMIFNSDHILTGVMKDITSDQKGRKTINKGSVTIEDIISSDCKPGDVINVIWETHELSPIHHEFYQGVQVIWLLQKKGNDYYANHPSRVQSLEEFEVIFKEINSYSTRVYLPETYYWNDQAKPVLLIFRNIESSLLKLPNMEWKDNVLHINEKVRFLVYPITSFNREKTILGKDPLEPLSGKINNSTEVIAELKADGEYRIWINMNEIFNFKRPSYYSVSLEINGFPSQTISAFESRTRVKTSDKNDFLKIAKDRFSSEQKKHTVQVIMDAVGEKTAEGAFEKVSNLKSLRLADSQIIDISPLGSFSQLEYLDLSGNKIQDLSPIRQMRNLTFLDLSDNRISNIEVLGYLGTLNLLDLSKNEISNISPLKNLMGLFFLYLKANDIDDLTPLESLKRIKILDLSQNEIEEIKTLGKLLLLQELDLKNNNIKVLDALTYSRNLTLLDVRNNPVSYVEHFDALINKHTDEYGKTIELKLLHDAYDEKKKADKNGEPQPLLPEAGKESNHEIKTKVEEKKEETFREQVEKAGIKIESEKLFIGNIVEFLEKESLVLIQFKKEELPKVDDLLTVYRKDDYIGTVKVIEIEKEQVIGRIVMELQNDKKLIMAVGDFARTQK